MSAADNTNTPPAMQEEYVQQLHVLFSLVDAQHVETFYKSYQHWQLKQQRMVLQEQLATIEQHIVDNSVLMQLTQPSPIALATLTRLQSYGVDDVDLLDSMLEHGDTWLDHTLQLLEQCERLDFIHDNYTEWCRHALEGAYDWLDSINENEVARREQLIDEQVAQQAAIVDDTTEALLVQKLMSEDETLKIPAIILVPTSSAPIPSILSYSTKAEVAPEAFLQHEEHTPMPTPPVYTTPSAASADKQQKSPKRGLVSRVMAKVWRT